MYSAGVSEAAEMPALAKPLLVPSPRRAQGKHASQPVLLQAEAGAGKTWSCMQLAHTLAVQCAKRAEEDKVPLVPVLIYVQRLSRFLQGRNQHCPLSENVLLQ